ncbi:CPBP family intramembrane metalloprotease [Rhodobacteraceae bacterium NNCM2]|nr:CPBP family intramembrane metalloprotease [Coraliihabitans acroporae]
MQPSLFAGLTSRGPDPIPAFRAWVGWGRRRPALWRMLLGLAIIGACWLLTTMVIMIVPAFFAARAVDASVLAYIDTYGMTAALQGLSPVLNSLLVLLTFGGMWVGVWLALRLLHKRSLASTLSARGRWSMGHFWGGFLVALSFSAIMALLAYLTASPGTMNEVDPFAWGWAVIPLFFAVAVQSCGEELFFRGYLQQQLAARCRSPWIWLILPSVLFGLLHGGDGWQGVAYILVTALIGIVAGVMVWRTGSLAAAMGLHLGNNFSVFVLIGPEALPRMLSDPEWVGQNFNLTTFLIDGGFFLIVGLVVMSRFSPLKAVSRSRPTA